MAPEGTPRPVGAPRETQPGAHELSLLWIVRIRSWAVAAEAVAILVARYAFGIDLPLAALASVVSFTLLTNVGLSLFIRRGGRVTAETIAFTLGSDSLLLTALLYLTGGPSNPFSVLFLVQITIAAMVLSAPYTGALVLLSLACYAFLFATRVPIPDMSGMQHDGRGGWTLHLEQMFCAFALAASLIAYFVSRVAATLRERECRLAEAEKKAQESERLAALTTLSAGAAHELGTPLMTISLAAEELLSQCDANVEGSPVATAPFREDIALIVTESARCRDIVQQMRLGAGGATGELAEETPLRTILTELTKRLGTERAAKMRVEGARTDSIIVPWRGLVQSLVSLVDNGLEASKEKEIEHEVRLLVVVSGDQVVFEVVDRGRGMSEEVRARVGQPFFSTKPPGFGMGLGVLLARTYAERLGGSLRFTSELGRGTKARLLLPLPRPVPARSASRYEGGE